MKQRMNISVDSETYKKLKQLAENAHKSVSQWITDKVWEADSSPNQEREQNK